MDSTTYTYVLDSITFTTFALQFYVIYLVVQKTPSSTRQYCYFLYLFAISDLTFTFVLDILLAPGQVSGLFASNLQGLAKYLPPDGQRLMLAWVIHSGTMLILAQDYCLAYRFTVISNKTVHRRFMSLPSKIGFNLLGQCIGFLLGYLTYISIMDEETQRKNFKLEPAETQALFPNGEFFIWFDMHSPVTLFFFASMFFAFALSEGVSIALVIFILRMLKKNSASLSKNTYRLHRQFTLLLAVQLALPAVLILIPVVLTILLGLFGIIFGTLGTQIGYIIFSSYAFLNSTFTILFITPYREDFRSKMKILHIDKLLCCGERLFNKTSVSTISLTNHSNLNFASSTNARRSQRQAPVRAFN